MAWISFSFLDLTGSITGGLITNLNVALGSLGSILPGPLGAILGVVGGAFIGLALIFLFPIHWAIFYRPDDVMLLISIILPWILCCSITSLIFAHSPRGGIHTSLAIGIGYMMVTIVIYLLLRFIPVIGPLIGGIIDGLTSGLTDLPYLLAVFTSILEGSLVGAVFGGFIGSLKYKGSEAAKAKKGKKSTVKTEDASEPTLGGLNDRLCPNCGMKVPKGDEFCTNCGSKITS
jgi:hypothetical protein